MKEIRVSVSAAARAARRSRGPLQVLRGVAAAAAVAGAFAAPGALAQYSMGLEAYAKGEYDVALDLWKRYAVAGDVRSMKALGDYYSNATIVNSLGRKIAREKEAPANFVMALKWYTLAAHHDFNEQLRKPSAYERNAQIEAAARLPVIRAQMKNTDVGKAEKLVADTFERGSPRDIYRIGEMYRRGAGVKKDNVRAYQLFMVAESKGVPDASLALEDMRNAKLVNGKEIESAEKKFATWAPPLPEELKGDTKQMAEMKRLKKEIEQLQLRDALRAVSDIDVYVLQHALKALGFYYGDIDNKMGQQTRDAIRRFQYSRVEKEDDMTAEEKRNAEVGVLSRTDTVELIEKAAKNAKNPIAQYTYGIMYLQEIGVREDGVEAEKWLLKAAAQNIAEAHYALGVMYRNGSVGLNPVRPDRAKAALHFAKAASLGYRRAQRALEQIEFESPRSVEE